MNFRKQNCWVIPILNLNWYWQIIYWDFQINIFVGLYYFYYFYWSLFLAALLSSFLPIQIKIWLGISRWFSELKWILKVCSSQVSAKMKQRFHSFLAWGTWMSPGLLLEQLLALWAQSAVSSAGSSGAHGVCRCSRGPRMRGVSHSVRRTVQERGPEGCSSALLHSFLLKNAVLF